MLEMGFIVGLGLIVFFMRASWSVRMWMLSHPLIMDIAVFIVLTALHWGTFSGVMVAAIGALTCSVALSIGRKAFGYRVGNMYHPGMFNVAKEL